MQNKFYRVSNIDTNQGLWYDYSGNFTGLIHNQFNFCLNNSLQMDFDHDLRGYLSATDNYESLFKWFTREDILRLQNHGFFIHAYLTGDFKFYDRFQHHVINQSSSKICERITLFEY